MNKMFFLILIVSVLALPSIAQSDVSNDECFNCHAAVGDQAELYRSDVHFSYSISCAACHGGDSSSDDQEIAMSKEKGFKGIPVRKERYLVCVNCHSSQEKMNSYNSKKRVDQYEKLKSSVHFKPSFNNQGPVADCVTCHGVHNTARVSNSNSPVYPTKIVALCGSCHSNASFMKNYNPALPIDQVAKYRSSVHGLKNSMGDKNAAQCSSCHGSHEIKAVNDPHSLVYPSNIPAVCSNCHSDKTKMAAYKIKTDQFDSYVKSVHGKSLLEKGDLSAPSCNDCHGNHGSVPPGVESISKVCGSCHTLNMELFEKSVHKQAFDKGNIPECESCHGNHNIAAITDELLGVGKNSSCIKCHKDEDNGFKAAHNMKKLIDSLKMEEEKAKVLLEEAQQKGMDVSDPLYSLKDIRQILIQTRTIIHGFDMDKFNDEIKTGFEISSSAKKEGADAIDNYYFRRKGLFVSTFIVTLLVIGLYIKIRKLEKKD